MLVNKTIRTKFPFESGLFCISSAHRLFWFFPSLSACLSHFVSRENYCLPRNQVTVLTDKVACCMWRGDQTGSLLGSPGLCLPWPI